ncbi:hypothetical protein Tco_0715027 [Tanacetum coccineum]
MAVLTQRIDKLTKGKSEKGKNEKGKSEKGLIAESFDWDEEYVSSDDEGTIRIRAFMAIAEDEPFVGKADARFEDQRKNMVNTYNLLKQELSLHKSELSNLKNSVSINCSFQNEVIRVNLENESLKDEIFELKRVIEKWTCSKVTLDQLLSEQIPGNIVKALRGKGRRKKNNLSKKVLFSKADVSTSESAPMITSDSEDDSDIQGPLPPLPKLTEVNPSGASKSLISLSDLTGNMADLTLNTASEEIKKSSNKVSQTYVIKKRTESEHPAVQSSCPDKNAFPLTEQLLLTLMKEVKGIKNQILIPSDTSSSVSQACSSKTPKQKAQDQNIEEEKDDKFVNMEEIAEEQSKEIPTAEQLLDEVDKQNKVVQETPKSPYDTESEIKVDSDYESMLEDDLRSVSGFEDDDSDNTQGNDMSYSDHIFQDDNASAERLSLPDHMDHICEEVSSLHSKLGDMKSSIIHQVSAEIKSSLPTLVTTAL